MMAGRILLNVASGYIVSRLLRVLEEGGCLVQRLTRHPERVVPRASALALMLATTLQTAVAQTQAPVRTVPFVDLDRYVGGWFEIARFPNRFQHECVGDVRATYARRPDGRIDVVNRCRTAGGETEARGVARIVDEQGFAKLKVRFAPAWLSFLPVWGDYWIIGLAPDYSWAVVGNPGRDYLWILARTPQLDEQSTAAATAAARNNGFDVERLVPTLHRNPTASARPNSATAAKPGSFAIVGIVTQDDGEFDVLQAFVNRARSIGLDLGLDRFDVLEQVLDSRVVDLFAIIETPENRSPHGHVAGSMHRGR